ncbi:MAG: hypothetical protein RLZZ511_400 [Cyanobacteriota bacterium]|jgi:hypothetical protein
MSVTELLPQIQRLSLLDKQQILQFLQADLKAGDDQLEAIADRLADEFHACFNDAVPRIPDAALTRSGIYEEHP